MKSITTFLLIGIFIFQGALPVSAQKKRTNVMAESGKYEFPTKQPNDANVNKPYEGAILTVSPPGFCWWRIAEAGTVTYKLFVYEQSGKEFFVSEAIDDCVYVPDKVFPSGNYSWIIRAYDKTGKEVAQRPVSSFSITKDAYSLPMPDAATLVSNIPTTHPRLIFTRDQLPQLKKDLQSKFKKQYKLIRDKAEKGLNIPLAKEPTFHLLGASNKEFAQKRTDYRVDYHHYEDVYLEAVEPLSFMYMVTGEKKYGDAAKKHLLRLTELPLTEDGPLVFFDSKFDEVTLQIADALPRAYDWAYDAFTQAEREKMETWMVAMGNNLLQRMSAQKRDFFFYSGESHDGRVPPYLINFALCLANHPAQASQWMNFAIKASLTVYPQWASEDGGWAEGVDYALTYSGRFIPPIEALYRMTGFNLWERPFYKNFPYFLTYCLSPIGEISPFGDTEDAAVSGNKATTIHSMLRFYAERNKDAQMRWWVNLFKPDPNEASKSMKGLVQDIMLADNTRPQTPQNIKQERTFKGIGWSAIHSDITHPEQDLFLLFKSSPFGPESHSHLDQNSFAIMKGGKALAIPAGSRYPQHGSPFHTKYTRQTLAHNTLLINGKGQIDKDPTRNANIFADEATEHISYVAGEAHKAYGETVKRFDRHMVMLRPSVILIMDDLEFNEPSEVEWLLHGKEKFVLDETKQSLLSKRNGEQMSVQFISPIWMKFSQNDTWPLEPKTGYPMVTTSDPVNQYHFTGMTNNKVNHLRIATVMIVNNKTKAITKQFPDKDGANIEITFEDKSTAKIKMQTGNQKTLMEITYSPISGSTEKMIINQK